jgi:3'-phosphoadenosine 5'-phosphosulfate sulfotransferase (PAPS reductase)/FAD synthetase
VGVSGGKDSVAVLLWVVHESGYPPANVIVNFTDVGNESPITYDYVRFLSDYLMQRGYAPVMWLKPPLDFFELAHKKKRFPSAKGRFCVEYLKIKPMQQFIAGLKDDVTSISGVRASESKARTELPERAFDQAGYQVYRPILHWSVDDVWAYLDEWNVPRNPLYDMGFRRVGCFPCCMTRKDEIRLIAMHFPEVIDHIREAEKDIGSSFFHINKVPILFRHTPFSRNGKTWMCGSIDDVVDWSFTKRGGKQYEMFFDLKERWIWKSGARGTACACLTSK